MGAVASAAVAPPLAATRTPGAPSGRFRSVPGQKSEQPRLISPLGQWRGAAGVLGGLGPHARCDQVGFYLIIRSSDKMAWRPLALLGLARLPTYPRCLALDGSTATLRRPEWHAGCRLPGPPLPNPGRGPADLGCTRPMVPCLRLGPCRTSGPRWGDGQTEEKAKFFSSRSPGRAASMGMAGCVFLSYLCRRSPTNCQRGSCSLKDRPSSSPVFNLEY